MDGQTGKQVNGQIDNKEMIPMLQPACEDDANTNRKNRLIRISKEVLYFF